MEPGNKYKIMLYCQLGGAIDMADFSINMALDNAGLGDSEFNIVFICWKTPEHSYKWLEDNNFGYVNMIYDEGHGFLWNLYKGWNLGYEIGFKFAPYVCPIATDHSFHKNWLKNMLTHCRENRIVNCKLIEPGVLPSLHTTRNFGPTIAGKFDQASFESFAESIAQDKIVFDDIKGWFHQNQGVGGSYGHRLDAMPFVVPFDVWQRFGPMQQTLNPYGTTGDTDFFDRCREGGVEIVKVLNAISYHSGGVETQRNQGVGIYT